MDGFFLLNQTFLFDSDNHLFAQLYGINYSHLILITYV